MWKRRAAQVTKELKNSLRQLSLNTKAVQCNASPGKCLDKIQLWFKQTFVSVPDRMILHNPNPAFLQFFTTVVFMKQRSLDLLP